MEATRIVLDKLQFDAEYIHGDIEYDQRENLFNLFEKNQIQILNLKWIFII